MNHSTTAAPSEKTRSNAGKAGSAKRSSKAKLSPTPVAKRVQLSKPIRSAVMASLALATAARAAHRDGKAKAQAA